MDTIRIKKGLDLPISGTPEPEIRQGNPIDRVALIGADYIGLKPSMLVKQGDRVQTGQPLFTDKKNTGVLFTSPASGTVAAIHRGPKRKFESLVIECAGEDSISFLDPASRSPEEFSPVEIRNIVNEAGLWTSFRTRPYGKIPALDANPASLFITAMDTAPLAPAPQLIINRSGNEYQMGLRIIKSLLSVPIHYCTGREQLLPVEEMSGLTYHQFQGPHPAGLASTHIHFIDPVSEDKVVWQIGYQDIIAIGHLFTTGRLWSRKTVSLAGATVTQPSLVTTCIGASLTELCKDEFEGDEVRVISGSVLSGREAQGNYCFLGRYHNQVSMLADSNGRALFNWVRPGRDRFSITPVFSSALNKDLRFPFSTALWGGKRAIYPLGTYEQVMPLDIIATSLLKALAVGDTAKAKDLGCLELVEEDLALCGFVCPGKNEFGPALRRVLTAIEQGD